MPTRERTELGRYALHDEIASGGMATVHLGRLKGAVGFSKMVAIKRLHPQYAKDPDFVSMFLDEARLAARIRHPNVVPTLDVVADTGELFLVMEYVHGVSLHRMVKLAREQRDRIPVDVACGIAVGALRGLHAAHEAKSERGKSLDIVHRDVSPQNVMVGVDGMARVLDFGVAKASWRVQTTRQGQVKGKVSYMAPEQVMGGVVGPWTDVHALGIVLWELLTGERLFPVSEERGLLARFTHEVKVAPPSALNPDVPPELDAAVLQALAHTTEARQASAQYMADQIEAAAAVGTSARIGRFVQYLAEEELDQRASRIAEIEGSSVVSVISPGFGSLLANHDSAPTLKTVADINKAKAQPKTENETSTEKVPPPSSAGEDPSKISMARTLAASSMAPTQPQRRGPTLAIVSALVTVVVLLVLAKLVESEKPVAIQKDTTTQTATGVGASKAAVTKVTMHSTAEPPVASAPPVIALSALPSSEPPAAAPPEPEAAVEVPAEPESASVVDLAALPVEEAKSKGAKRSTKATSRRSAVRATKPMAAAPARPASNCTPPYTVDERGVRHLKMECMN